MNSTAAHALHLYLLMHNGYCMHLMPEHKRTVRFAYQVYVWISYVSHSKQRSFLWTELARPFLQSERSLLFFR